jgi:hypothetical protein
MSSSLEGWEKFPRWAYRRGFRTMTNYPQVPLQRVVESGPRLMEKVPDYKLLVGCFAKGGQIMHSCRLESLDRRFFSPTLSQVKSNSSFFFLLHQISLLIL